MIFEHDFPICKIDAASHLIGGIVYTNNEIDLQGDSASAEEIQKAAHQFLIDSRIVGLMHRASAPGCHVVESFISPDGMRWGNTTVRKGTWLVVIQVDNPDIWRDVQSGRLGGISMSGSAARSDDGHLSKIKVAEVSLVDRAANGKKFSFTKSEEDDLSAAEVQALAETVDQLRLLVYKL